MKLKNIAIASVATLGLAYSSPVQAKCVNTEERYICANKVDKTSYYYMEYKDKEVKNCVVLEMKPADDNFEMYWLEDLSCDGTVDKVMSQTKVEGKDVNTLEERTDDAWFTVADAIFKEMKKKATK